MPLGYNSRDAPLVSVTVLETSCVTQGILLQHDSSRHKTEMQISIIIHYSSLVLQEWDSSYNICILDDQSADQVRLDVKFIVQMSAITPSSTLCLYKSEEKPQANLPWKQQSGLSSHLTP